MKKVLVWLAVMAMVFGGAGYALAQEEEMEEMGQAPGVRGMDPEMMGMGRMMGMHPRMMGPEMMRFGFGLNLTEEQQKKLTDLRIRFVQERAKARAELIQTRAALEALLLDPSAKDEAIEAQAQKTANAYARLFLVNFRMGREMEGILTKEQREQMMRRAYRGPRRMGPEGAPMGPGRMMPGGPMPGR
jgi:Spy/CpxP family protein refolding chaperone